MKEKVSESDVIELLTTRISSLTSELTRAQAALNAIQDTRQEKKRISVKSKGKIDVSRLIRNDVKPPQFYDPARLWDEKILYVLKSQEAFREDIVKEISALEPALDSKKLLNVISVKLSQLLKQGTIQGVKIGRRYRYKLAS